MSDHWSHYLMNALKPRLVMLGAGFPCPHKWWGDWPRKAGGKTEKQAKSILLPSTSTACPACHLDNSPHLNELGVASKRLALSSYNSTASLEVRQLPMTECRLCFAGWVTSVKLALLTCFSYETSCRTGFLKLIRRADSCIHKFIFLMNFY